MTTDLITRIESAGSERTETMTELAKKLRERHSDYMIATGEDLQWLAEQLCAWPHRRVHPDRTMSDQFLRHSAAQTMLAQAVALEREPDEAMVERVAKAITLCPVCEGEGTVADGLDEAACSTPCPPCFGTGFDARAAIAAMKGTSNEGNLR